MGHLILNFGLKLPMAALAVSALFIGGSALAQSQVVDDPDRRVPVVAGVIEAVEPERGTIIVDGRRFRLATPALSFDGSEIRVERAIRMLSKGDEVKLIGVESSRDDVRRIQTRLH